MKNIIRIFIICTLFASVTIENVFSVETLKVDLSDSIRPATHCASGALYGITADLPRDITGLVASLKGNVYVQPAISGNGHQQPIGDAFDVAKRLQGTTGKVQIRLADILPGWPYRWPGWDSWKNSVTQIIQKKLNSGYSNFDGYEIWNEPYGTWQSSNGDFHSSLWKPTYELIRRIDPNAKIIGPSFAYYNSSRMETFLKYCKENNCEPDVICWHQWGSGGFIGAVENLRSLEKKYGMKEHPLSINEYSSETHTYEGCPGVSVPFIAKFERNKVESAMISWWFTNLPGRLGSLLTANNEKGGGWWLYKWYGDMTGYMARVTPPNDKSDKVDGFAAVDKKNNYVSVILGGNSVGDVNVVFSKVPAFLGGKVHVKIERVTWKDKDTPVASTDLISETDVVLNGTTLTIPVKIESQFYAYRIYMTPLDVPQTPYRGEPFHIPGIVEAEDYDVAGQGFSYMDNETENKGGEYRTDGVDIVQGGTGYAVGYTEKGEWMEYTIQVDATDVYAITANISNSSELEGFRLFLDGRELTNDYMIPQVSEDWSAYEEILILTTRLEEGTHELKIEIVGSYVNIDWLRFEKANSTDLNIIHPDDEALEENHYYDLNGIRLKSNEMGGVKPCIVVRQNKKGVKLYAKKLTFGYLK